MNIRYKFVAYDKELFKETFYQYVGKGRNVFLFDTEVNRDKALELYSSLLAFEDNLLLTMSEFKERIFINDMPILKGYKRLATLYQALNKEQKIRFNIHNIFDVMDLAENFFNLYIELAEAEIASIDNIKGLYDWQEEELKNFEDLRRQYRDILNKKGYQDNIFLYNINKMSLSFFKDYNNFVFVNNFYLSKLEKNVIARLLAHDKVVELNYQCLETDFDRNKIEFLSVKSPVKADNNIKVYETSDSLLQEINIANSIINTKFQKHVILDPDFEESDYAYLLNSGHVAIPEKLLFGKTELSIFLNAILELLLNSEVSKSKGISFSTQSFLNVQNLTLFSNYYNITKSERNILAHLIRNGFKRINREFGIFKLLFDDLEKIIKLKNFNDFYTFFSSLNFEFLSVSKYADIKQVYFECLEELKFISNELIDNKWGNFFDKGCISIGLLRLFIKNLKKKEVLYGKTNKQSKIKIANLFGSEYASRSNLTIINAGNISLRKNYEFLLNNHQRELNGLRGWKSFYLESKYMLYRSIFSAKNVNIYFIKNSSKDLDAGAILEELRLTNNIKFEKAIVNEKGYKTAALSFFKPEALLNMPENDANNFMLLDKNELIEDGEISMGFYDYNELSKCQYRYYLKAVAKLHGPIYEVDNRLEPSLLGNVVHQLLNKVGDITKEQIIKNNNFNVDKIVVKELLIELIDKEQLKIPNNYSTYYNRVLYPFLIEGVTDFYDKLKLCLARNKVKNFFIEDAKKRLIIDKENEYKFYIKGKVDLRVELYAEEEKYIIDYKTGHAEPKQLDFYQFLYYENDENIKKLFYRFFDKQLKEEKRDGLTKLDVINNIERFIESDKYNRSEVKSMCRSCEYFDICKVRGK